MFNRANLFVALTYLFKIILQMVTIDTGLSENTGLTKF